MKPGQSESRCCTGSRTSTKFTETGMYRAMSFSSEVVAKNERKNVRKVRHDPCGYQKWTWVPSLLIPIYDNMYLNKNVLMKGMD